tara:strand:+ start:285 stop:779 length:495 start_codon:yes stop_codon:yes gene_type:complete
MKNTNWDAIEPGDVVSFIYKGKGDNAKSARRIVVCLEPRFPYRKKSTKRLVEYFIGIEIFNSLESNKNPTIIKQLFDILGEESDLILDDTGTQSRMEQIYRSLKAFIERNPGMFKTYFYRECRRRRVFLEDKYDNLNSLQVKQITGQLLNEDKSVIVIKDDYED